MILIFDVVEARSLQDNSKGGKYDRLGFTQQLLAQAVTAVTEMIRMCWPCCAFVAMMIFTLGFYVGKWWQALVTRRLQRQMEGEAALDSVTSQKEGQRHKDYESLDVKELRRRLDRQEKIEVFIAKSGTKVHFIRECPVLKAADVPKIQTKTCCELCLRKQRLLLMTREREEGKGMKEHF